MFIVSPSIVISLHMIRYVSTIDTFTNFILFKESIVKLIFNVPTKAASLSFKRLNEDNKVCTQEC